MRSSKRLRAISVLLSLSAAVLLAQVCNSICLASTCHTPGVMPAQSQPADHCHQTESQPQPAPESHHCRPHELLAGPAFSKSPDEDIRHPDSSDDALIAALPHILLPGQQPQPAEAFTPESPPRIPQRLNLRI